MCVYACVCERYLVVLAVGPEAMYAIVVGYVHKHASDRNTAEENGAMLAFVAGTILVACGLLRLGFLQNIISQPALRGYRTGVAIVLVCDQLDVLLGLPALVTSSGSYASVLKVKYVIAHLSEVKLAPALFGLGGVLFLLLAHLVKRSSLRRYTAVKFFPDVLLLVVAGIVVGNAAKIGSEVPTVGRTRPGLPEPRMPAFAKIGSVLESGVVLALVGFVESIAVSKLPRLHEEHLPVSANRELLALGVANVLGSFFQAFPTVG